MFDFDPFDPNVDGDAEGIDFLGFHYLMPCVLRVDHDPDGERYAAWDDEAAGVTERWTLPSVPP